MQRPLVKQEFTTFSLQVQTVGTPINAAMGITTMIDSVVICVPSGAANSVFLGGDQGVTTTSGLELLAPSLSSFVIDHDGRQLYELQFPLMDLRNGAMCKMDQGDQIPFVVWDLSSMYLVAAAVTTVSIAAFKAVYV